MILFFKRMLPVIVAISVSPALAQTLDPNLNTFTYQGTLNREGVPYTGTADYRFGLYAVPSGGDPITPTRTVSGVAVEQGLFHTPIDFGTQAHGPGRYLQIEVRTPAWDGNGTQPPFVPFLERTPLNAVPFALTTRGISVNAAGNHVGINTAQPAFPLHVSHDLPLAMQVESSHPQGTWLNLSNTAPNGQFWRLISSGPFNEGGSGKLLIGHGTSGGGHNTVMTMNRDGRVGINTPNPGFDLDVNGHVRLGGNINDVVTVPGAIQFRDGGPGQTTAFTPIVIRQPLSTFNLSSNNQVDLVITAPGAQPGMMVVVNPPYRLWPLNAISYAYVESPGRVVFTIVSTGGPDRVYGAGTWRVTVLP